MELILISDSKLKIMLTADDMESYDISEELFEYEKKDIRKIFDRVLDEAKRQTGFDSSCGKLVIQVYPSKDGGCEVYVTRGSEPEKKGEPRERNVQPKKRKEGCVYVFDSISDTVSACELLLESGYENESGLYERKRGGGQTVYYLVLEEEVPQDSRYRKRKNVSKSDLAAEYGRRIGGREAVLYITEHAHPIAERNAVKLMGGR